MDATCYHCPCFNRPRNLESKYLTLRSDGSYSNTRAWFCSESCFEKEIDSQFTDKVYDEFLDTKEGEKAINALIDQYPDHPTQARRYTEEGQALLDRAREHDKEMRRKEWDDKYGVLDREIRQRQKDLERQEMEQKKEAERQQAADERRREQERREAQRAADRAERLAEQQARAADRAEAAEERRLERERKDQEKRDAEERKRLEAEQKEIEWQETLNPKPIREKIRLEHTHVLGPSGSGKSTILQNHTLNDYWSHNPNKPSTPPAYIVIDPKGMMVERLAKTKILADKVVIIDPEDIPALNLFETLGRDPAQLISDFSYIFSTTRQKLTGKQVTCFSYCARLLFTLPEANLVTLLDLLDDGANNKPRKPMFWQAVRVLPDMARRFFEQDYYSKNYASTREEIKARVYGVAQNDHLAKMFNANKRKLDIAQCIRDRKVLLVNTRMTQLAEDHQTLGRYIITLVQDAIQSVKPEHPVYLVIDEAQEFMDAEKTPRLLRLLREYNGGAVIAHQNMYCAELDEATRNAISTNTSIKYAASPEGQDLNYMARDLRCDPEWLKDVHKSETHARFACYVRGMNLKHPFIVTSKLGWIEDWPKISDAEYQALRARNKAALADIKTLSLKRPETHKPPQSEGKNGSNTLSAEADKTIVPPEDPSRGSRWTPPQ
jgi:ABC-type molybdenum transport system ATPase subunit/photorepair protein PhrA